MDEPEQPLRRIFLAALEIHDLAQRAAFLSEACGGDLALLDQVQALLQANASAGAFLPDKPLARTGVPGPGGVVACDAHPTAGDSHFLSEQPGDRLGRYRLLQKIGEGGCGLVYMAEQQEPVRRKVALKVIKLGMDTRQVITRFEAERQALAMMDHPNIARVFDASSTETGRPFFVMELVEGVRITEYCDRKGLSIWERLELFIDVCRAVQHAHQKGVIHRDLKPSNILVAEDDGLAIAKVIDFGIAKATEGRLTDGTLFTSFHQFVGTPAYMSPEQAALTGADVDTRSDVYSLGVLLYELLTGSTPFDTKELVESGLDGMRQIICEREPARPSTRVAQRREAASAEIEHRKWPIAKDLDWIVIKCLEKDRNRRYPTANSLASDVRRHLDNEPILARPPSRLYEFQKTVRRHKMGFIAATAVMVALASGTMVSTLEVIRARRADGTVRQESYSRAMLLGYEALHANDYHLVQEILTQTRTAAVDEGAVPQRVSAPTWEWRHLQYEARDESPAVFARCPDEVHALAVAPGGQWIAAGLRKGHVLLWPPEGGTPAADWDASGRVRCLEFSPDGRVMASGEQEGQVRVRTVPSGEVFFEDDRHEIVLCLQFSPDGQRLAIGTENGYALADLGSRRILKEGRHPDPGAWKVGIASDFKTVATLIVGRGLHVESNGRSEYRGEVVGEFHHFCGKAMSPDGRVFAVPLADHAIELWDLAPLKRVRRLEAHTAPTDVLAWTKDGHWIATGGVDQTIALWNADDGKLTRRLRGHFATVHAGAFGPDNRTLYTGGSDMTVRKWTPFELHDAPERLAFPQDTGWTGMVPGGRYVWVQTSSGNVLIYDTAHLEKRPIQGFSESPQWSLSPDGKVFWGDHLGGNRLVAWWMKASGSMTLKAAEVIHGPLSRGPAVSDDGSRLALRHADGRVEIWNREPWTSLGQWQISKPNTFSMFFDATANHLFILDNLGLFVVDLPGNRVLPLDDLKGNAIVRLALSTDGRMAVSSGGNSIVLWDLNWPAPPRLNARLMEGERWSLDSLAISPDKRTLAMGLESGEIRLWDLRRRMHVGVLRGHRQSVTDLAFRSDDESLVSLTRDEVRVWRVREGPLADTTAPDAAAKIEPMATTSIRCEMPPGIVRARLSPGARYLDASSDSKAFVFETDPLRDIRSSRRHSIVLPSTSPHGHWMVVAMPWAPICEIWRASNYADWTTPDDADDRSTWRREWRDDTPTFRLHRGVHVVLLQSEGYDVAGLPTSAPVFSPDGARVALSTRDGDFGVWEVEPWKLVINWKCPVPDVGRMLFDAEGRRVLAASGRNLIVIGEIESGTLRTVQCAGLDPQTPLAISPDNRALASTDWAGRINLVRCTPGEEPSLSSIIFTAEPVRVESLTFSGEGRQLLAGLEDGRILVVDMDELRVKGALTGHRRPVLDLGFHAGSGRLVSVSQDEVRVWDPLPE